MLGHCRPARPARPIQVECMSSLCTLCFEQTSFGVCKSQLFVIGGKNAGSGVIVAEADAVDAA